MPVAVTAVDAGNPVELVGNVAQIIGDRLVGDVAAGKVEVSNQELRTVRDAMRQLNRMVDDSSEATRRSTF